VSVTDHQQAMTAYREWARRTAQNELFGTVGDDDEPNPLIALAAKAVQIHDHRLQKQLPPRGELFLAVHSLATLHKIRTLQSALANVAHKISLEKGVTDMSSLLHKLMKQASTLLNSGNLDAAEALLNELEKRLKHKVTVESGDDGEDGYSDDSNPSLDAKNSDRANNDGEDDEELGDEEDDEDGVSKASINEVVRTHSEANRPGSLSESKHPSSSNARHKFEALVQDIKNKHGVPQTEAMAIARQYHPGTFADYQKQEASPRSIGKVAPPTYEDLVNVEMKKGVTREVAGQRVAQLHGFRAFDNQTSFAKADIASAALEDVADQVYQSDASLSRCEALRKARLSNPTLFRRMQR
jgi:hypothetical protein